MFGASHSGAVACLDLASGRLIWEVKLAGRIEASPALLPAPPQALLVLGAGLREHMAGHCERKSA